MLPVPCKSQSFTAHLSWLREGLGLGGSGGNGNSNSGVVIGVVEVIVVIAVRLRKPPLNARDRSLPQRDKNTPQPTKAQTPLLVPLRFKEAHSSVDFFGVALWAVLHHVFLSYHVCEVGNRGGVGAEDRLSVMALCAASAFAVIFLSGLLIIS